jgi:hypothetical protein
MKEEEAKIRYAQSEAWRSISTQHSICTMGMDERNQKINVELLIEAITKGKKMVDIVIDDIKE